MYLKYTHLIELHTNTRICHTLKMQVLMCMLTKDYTQFKHSPNEFSIIFSLIYGDNLMNVKFKILPDSMKINNNKEYVNIFV